MPNQTMKIIFVTFVLVALTFADDLDSNHTYSYEEFKEKFQKALVEVIKSEIGKYHAAHDNTKTFHKLVQSIERIRKHLALVRECYKAGTYGADYRGYIGYTKSGSVCQDWNSQSYYGPENYPNAGLVANFCRGFAGYSPWCYTMDGSWDYCDIPICPNMYRTELETWESEIWELLKKDRQSLNEDQQSFDKDQQSLNEDPDTTSYDEFKQKFQKAIEETTQLEIRKYYAANDDAAMENLTGSITQLENCLGLRGGLGLRDDCYEGDGKEYRGVHATTKSGRKCQPWINDWGKWKPDSYPELTSNHCRNPSGEPKPWCYWKEDGDTEYGIRNTEYGWEWCDVPKCSGRTKEKRQSINQDSDSPYSEFKEKFRETLREIIQLEIRKKDAVRDDKRIMKKLKQSLDFLQSKYMTQNGKIRLMRGDESTLDVGRLEIYHRGEWGTVCDDGLWDSANGQNLAKVVCRIKGFADGTAWRHYGFEAKTRRIWLNNVACIGNETSLCDCPHNGWGSTESCDHHEAGKYEIGRSEVSITCV